MAINHDLAERLARADATGMWVAVGDWRLFECADWVWVAAKTCLEHTPEPVDDEEATADKTPTTTLRAAINWVITTAASGIIGNRVDAGLVTLVAIIMAELKVGNTPRLDQPPSSLPAPTVESPLDRPSSAPKPVETRTMMARPSIEFD